ncbi:MAG: hypothetical protein OEW40_18630, partial [Cyclobacteriaceae bacterium]|nr:hypothetical protein [Cyclobacteriaceae bacterium]
RTISSRLNHLMRTLRGRYGPACTTRTTPSPRNAHARPKTGRGPIGTCWKFGWVWCGHEVSTEIVLDNTFEAQPSNKNAPGPLWPRMYHSDCAQPAQCPCQAKDWPRSDWNMLEVGCGTSLGYLRGLVWACFRMETVGKRTLVRA